VDGSVAWLQQSIADRAAGELLVSSKRTEMYCHAIAKWQQAVEKAIKAVIAALRDAGVLAIEIGYRHEVARFISVLLRLPHGRENKTIQQHLRGLFNEHTRANIRNLDELAPHRPAPGQPPQRNTEYPFQVTPTNWSYPAAEDVFSSKEIQRFRNLAHRIVAGAGKIVSAVRRGPR
jgi:HEPN domain